MMARVLISAMQGTTERRFTGSPETATSDSSQLGARYSVGPTIIGALRQAAGFTKHSFPLRHSTSQAPPSGSGACS